MENSKSSINFNKEVHNSGFGDYEKIHIEIFNPTEQNRISNALQECISYLNTNNSTPIILDFGSGTGNLTNHLLKLDVGVIAADISSENLALLKDKYPNISKTLKLNGNDLSDIEDNSIDMIVTYSVLHHVPDYLKIIKEFVRVVKIGGIIYIDHEASPNFWKENSIEYNDYLKNYKIINTQPLKKKLKQKTKMLFSIKAWRRYLIRKIYGLTEEGDIHVFKNDHIEWDKIESILELNCEKIKINDYLLCRERDHNMLYTKFKEKCADMRMVIYRKNDHRNI